MKLIRRGANLPQKYHYKPPATAAGSSPIPVITDPLVLWNQYQKQQQQSDGSKGSFVKGGDAPRAATSMGIREGSTAPAGSKSSNSLLTANNQNTGPRRSQTSQSTLFDLSMSLKIAQRMRYEVGLDLTGELPPPTRFTPSRQAIAASRPAHEVDAGSWESNGEGFTTQIPSLSATGENFEVLESDPYNLTGTTPGTWRLNGEDEPLTIGTQHSNRAITPQAQVSSHRPMTVHEGFRPMTVHDGARPMTRAQGGHPVVEPMSDHILQQTIGDPSSQVYPRACSPIKQTDWRTLKQACDAKDPTLASRPGTVAQDQHSPAEGFTKVALPSLRRLPSASDLPKRWSDVNKQPTPATTASPPGLTKPPMGVAMLPSAAGGSNSTPQQNALRPPPTFPTRADKTETLPVMQPPAKEGRRRSREFSLSTPNTLSLDPPAAPLATILDAAAKRVAPVDFSFPTLTKVKQLVRPATQSSTSRSQEPGTRYQPTTNVAKVLTTSHARGEEQKEEPADLTELCLKVSQATLRVSAFRPS